MSIARRPIHSRPLAFVAASSLFATACTGGLNRSVGVLGADLPDLDPEATAVPSVAAAEVAEVAANPDSAWSPVPFDRTTWPTVVVVVPRGQVEVNPTPRFRTRPMPGREASSRRLPSPEQAVSVATDAGRVARSGVLDPLRAAWSLVESPVGLVVRPPWAVVTEPNTPVELLPPRGDAPIGIRRIDGSHDDGPADPAESSPADSSRGSS